MRGQSPDQQIAPPRAAAIAQQHVALTIPSPEQFGIDTAFHHANLESSAARHQLDRFGAVCVNLEKLADGRNRLTCLLATTNANRNHRVDAVAATEEEVIRLVVERCEKWAGER